MFGSFRHSNHELLFLCFDLSKLILLCSYGIYISIMFIWAKHFGLVYDALLILECSNSLLLLFLSLEFRLLRIFLSIGLIWIYAIFRISSSYFRAKVIWLVRTRVLN